MASFSSLSEEALIHCYRMAVKLKLEPDFIHLVSKELEKRKLHLQEILETDCSV
ncbi:sporulation histidine kinase inhibitor Sda [Gorillibacterium sp. sgz5001074]|uniref:sporulation histidine kinase inhibitor Sda n=1 Tax=Gorillibacterium sp. sgz5001074 TaxID=3446695 RepID=UPI003F6782BD